MIKWEWENQEPTPTEAHQALESLGNQWGVPVVEYGAFVLPMMQVVGKYRDHEGRPTSKKYAVETDNVPTWKLYMQVPGRVAMLNRAQELNEWDVSIEPVSTQAHMPGFIWTDTVVLYRERVAIEGLGSRTGTAALKDASSQRVPPWEKLETAARGRAIAGWGIGVLPGSGIASFDEIELAAYTDYTPGPEAVKLDRDQILDDFQGAFDAYRSGRNRSSEEVAKYVQALALEFGVTVPLADLDGNAYPDLDPLNDAQLKLIVNRLRSDLRRARSQA